MADRIGAPSLHRILEEQVERFIGYLETQSPGWALKTAGVYSDDFWLGNAL